MRAEEAVKLLDKTLSESITSNIPEISVIHGKGTGALRTAIREFIQYHHLVKSFREGTLVGQFLSRFHLLKQYFYHQQCQ